MSVERIVQVLHTQTGLSGTQKLVLIGIANHDGDGGAWPSISTLAKYAECSERSAQRAVKVLEEVGLIVVEAQAGGTSRTRKDRRPNLYHFNLKQVTIGPHGVTSVADEEERGDIQRDDGVTSGASRGDTAMSPEPSCEPSCEPSNLPVASASVSVGERTPGQLANEVASGLYDKVKADTGKIPVGWKMPQMVKLLTPFFEAGWSVLEVKQALWTCHTSGYPITRPTIERELDGRGRTGARPSPNSPMGFLAAIAERDHQ